ncbi:hypothetical protein Emag_004714 [Eimeria magna]
MARAALNAIMNFLKRQFIARGTRRYQGWVGLLMDECASDVSPVALLSVGVKTNPEQPGESMTPGEGPLQNKQSPSGPDSSESSSGYVNLDDAGFSPTDQKPPSQPTPATPRNPSEEEDLECIPRKSSAAASQPGQKVPRASKGGPLDWFGGKGFGGKNREKPMNTGFEKKQTSKKPKGGPLYWLGRIGLGGKTSVSSMLQIPSQQEIDAREAAAAQEYNERLKQAASRAQPRLEEAGSSGSTERLSSAVGTYYRTYAILHAYILTTSAKILLESLKSTLVGAQTQMVVSTSELFSSLLSSLPGALASARHFMGFVMSIIEAALSQISNDTSNAQAYTTAAFIKLGDIDALVSHTAKRKSDLTLSLDRTIQEIDNSIKSELDFTLSGSLEAAMQMEIVERALSVINSNSESSSQVTYYILSGAQGKGLPVPPQAVPGFPPPSFGKPEPMGFRGPSEGAPPQAPGREAAPREKAGAVSPSAPEMLRAGMAEAEDVARRREQESIQDLGRNLAQGAPQFHSAPADYIMESQGTSSAACQTDFSLAAPTEEEKKTGVLPRSCGDRAAKAVETLVTRQLKKIERLPVRLFATQFDIESYVKELWQVEKKKIMDENSPAPSFYTLVSTGCASTSSDLTRQFWQAWEDRDLFRNVAANSIQSERLRRRVEILTRSGIVPFMTKDQDKRVGGSLNSVIANFLHEQRLEGEKIPKSSRVLASFMFSADHTLMVLEAMLKRAVGYAISFMERDDRQDQPEADQMSGGAVSRKDALNGSLVLFSSYKKLKGGSKDPFDPSMIERMLKHLQVSAQFINVLAADKNTKHLMGLLIHSWVQARGVHAAAEGFKPGASSKAPVKSTSLAAIFAKLWFESTLTSGAEGQKLKPFGSAVVSAGLQVAFFLHTVAEEYEAGLLKQMGAAIKSFFASIFKGSASASTPASWAVLQMRATRQHKVKARQYEGVLKVIFQLSNMFKKRFLESMYTTTQPEGLKAIYTVIQGLVGLWMAPLNEPFDFASNNISSAKKLFFYHTFFHPRGPSFVAARLIKQACSGSGNSLSFGVVVDVKDNNRKSVDSSDMRLKKKPLKIKRENALMASLNKLMATYTDPMTIVNAAMDLSLRCRGALRNPTGRQRSSSASSFASFPTTLSSNPQETEKPALESAELAGDSFEQLGDALSKQKNAKVKRDPWAEDQVLGSKLVLDSWCQAYKEKLLAKMAGIRPSKSSWEVQRQLDDVLDSTTEISIAIKKKANDRIISFKCLWMSGHHNQDAMKAERNAMMAYAICEQQYPISIMLLPKENLKLRPLPQILEKRLSSESASFVSMCNASPCHGLPFAFAASSSFKKRLARQLKGVKKLFKTKLRSIIRPQMVRPPASQYGLLHVGTEVWTGQYYIWPEAT